MYIFFTLFKSILENHLYRQKQNPMGEDITYSCIITYGMQPPRILAHSMVLMAEICMCVALGNRPYLVVSVANHTTKACSLNHHHFAFSSQEM